MIISLRGTNGSGKSTVIRDFLAAHKHKPLYGVLGSRSPEAYAVTVPKCKKETYILGPYMTACGGCDRLIPYELIPRLIEKYAKLGDVLFEGIIVASVYGQVGTLMEKYKKNAVMVFLDTSLEECIKRVQARRDSRKDDREFNPKNLTNKFKSIQHVRKKAAADGIMRVETVSSKEACDKLVNLLQKG